MPRVHNGCIQCACLYPGRFISDDNARILCASKSMKEYPRSRVHARDRCGIGIVANLDWSDSILLLLGLYPALLGRADTPEPTTGRKEV